MRAPRWLVFAVLAACKGSPGSGSAAQPAVSAPATSAPSAVASSAVPAPPASSAPPRPAPSATAAMPGVDAGAGACRVLRGPIELPVRSPAALSVRGESVDVVMNSDGKPRTTSFATAPPPPVPAASTASPAREPAEGGAAPGYAVACAVAADRVFCADRTGAVHRTGRDGGGDRVVASSRSGSRVAAAVLAGSHAALGYLASRQTSEGWVSEAWLAVDDDVPVRLSEDGSGATSLVFAPRKAAVLALAVDARAALTAVHARPVTFEGHALLGEDAVVFVGGPGDHRTAAALALPASGPGWALLPIAKDIGSFGMALVRLDEPTHVDEPVVWSMYPNGLDPAAVAAVIEGGKTWVARVRPQGADPGSVKVLEVGTVTAEGAFTGRDILATSSKLTDLALAADAHGALWLSWVDAGGSWLERLACR